MRRTIAALLLLGLLLPLSACGRAPAGRSGDGRLLLVASAFPEYDFLRAVAGELADIRLLLSPGTEAHSYEPSPQDIIAIQSCDLFVYGGGESDAWLDRVLDNADGGGPRRLRLMDCVALREEETQAHMTAEAHEHGETEYDEHVWTSPVNAMAIVESIRAALCELDADHAGAYDEAAGAYTKQLRALDAAFRSAVDQAVRRELIFGDRFPFLYFVREYGLEYAAAFPGCSSGTDANPATVAWLIDRVKAEGVPVVFRCDLSAGRLADTIAAESGAVVRTLWSCHTVSREDFDADETYLSLMRRNLLAIEEALG